MELYTAMCASYGRNSTLNFPVVTERGEKVVPPAFIDKRREEGAGITSKQSVRKRS